MVKAVEEAVEMRVFECVGTSTRAVWSGSSHREKRDSWYNNQTEGNLL
jgi:hypothetical protein